MTSPIHAESSVRSNLEPIEPADHELLLAFVQGSEPAFATLVRRHIDLVYSAALRQVQDPHTAADVTSAVFIILARKAGELRKHLIIPAWLHRTTSYTARKAVRARQRRVSYEQAAARLNEVSVQEPTNAEWEQMMPFLDAGLADLAAKEHEAVVLRFFQNKTFPEIAAVVGTTEEGARKRVERAVEKLRRFLAGRGIAVPIIVLTAMLGTQSVQAAPPGLASTITAVPPPGSLSPLVAELLKPDSRTVWKWLLGTMLGLLTLLLVTIPWVRPYFAAWTRSPTQTLRLLNQAAAAGDAERWASLVHTSNAEEQQVTIMLSSNIVAQAEVRRALIQRFGPAAYQASGFSRVFEETPEDLFSTAVERISEDHATVQLIPRPPLKFINVHGIWKFDFFHTTSATAAQAGRAAERTHAALLETHRHILQGLHTSVDDALLHYKQIR